VFRCRWDIEKFFRQLKKRFSWQIFWATANAVSLANLDGTSVVRAASIFGFPEPLAAELHPFVGALSHYIMA
jgi:hypothetical protein